MKTSADFDVVPCCNCYACMSVRFTGWVVLTSLFSFLTAIGLAACATTTAVTPQLAGREAPMRKLHAAVMYEGNAEYLPSALVPEPGASGDVVFRYAYRAEYGLKQLPSGVQLVNSLNFTGFPTSENDILVIGLLLVRDNISQQLCRDRATLAALIENQSTQSQADMRH